MNATPTTITINIPADLFSRITRAIEFDAWTALAPLKTQTIQEWILSCAAGNCESREGDMILDDEGRFVGDRLDTWGEI